ncbi:MAG: hypothetical protein COW84_01350 [Gammaproteobacteria bacterium CG22_combo_CG10-13_8_21_14_all_40_8]|nr:MAG: hypothetical protein COW84_01350 [Gammaproteobacteria bacterium CG22_combo_CG10-13_8_21_14_all_40_8]
MANDAASLNLYSLIKTEDAPPGKKARGFGRGADLFQIEWSANAGHSYCFKKKPQIIGAFFLLFYLSTSKIIS